MGRRESEAGFVSRSELKRRSERVEELALELLKLGAGGLRQAPLADAVRVEFHRCMSLRGPALKRQVKYLARLLRESGDIDVLLTFLEEKRGSKLKQDSAFKELERLRNLLVDEAIAAYDDAAFAGDRPDAKWDGPVLDSVAAELGADDLVDLRSALFSFARSRNKKYYRAVFRTLQVAAERERRRLLLGDTFHSSDTEEESLP